MELEARFEAALRRNLDFAAIRITIRTAVQHQGRRALALLSAHAVSRHAMRRRRAVAQEWAGRAALSQALSRFRVSTADWRRRLAQGRRRSRLMALMRGLSRFRAELMAARRSARAAQQRALRQQQALVKIHARLLFARWRIDHAPHAAAEHLARAASRRQRAQRALAVWALAAALIAASAKRAHRAAALREALAVAGAFGAWRRALSQAATDAALAASSVVHRRALCARAAWSKWRRAVLVAVTVATTAASVARRHVTRRRRWALSSWRRAATQRAAALATARGALATWACVARHRRRLAALVVRALRGGRAARCGHHLSLWRNAAGARQRVVAGIAHAGAHWRRRATWVAWVPWRRRARLLARLRHQLGSMAAAVARRRSAEVLMAWRDTATRRGGAAARRRLGDALVARKAMGGWRARARLVRVRALALRASAALTARATALGAMRRTVHAWHERAAPLGGWVRMRVQLAARMRWRRAARLLVRWWQGTSERRARARGLARARRWALHGAMVAAWAALCAAAAAARRAASLLGALRAVLRRAPLLCWAAEASARTAAHALDVACGGAVRHRRMQKGWLLWTMRLAARFAVASRLWATRTLIATDRARAHTRSACCAWHARSIALKRQRLWNTLCDGQRLVYCQKRALLRWRRRWLLGRAQVARAHGHNHRHAHDRGRRHGYDHSPGEQRRMISE